MASTSTSKVTAALLLALSSVAQADWVCRFANFPGCSAPFPPGHKNMGDAWWGIGSQDSGAKILKMSSTLLLNEIPANNKGVMAINTALENSNRDDPNDSNPVDETYQTLTVAYPPGYKACGNKDDEYCVFSSLYNRPADPQQFSAEPKAKQHNYGVILEFTYQPNSGHRDDRIVQVADGVGISNSTQQAPWQFWPKTECQCGVRGGIIPRHIYMNTKLTIAPGVKNWGDTVSFSKATAGKPKPNADFTEWTIDWIDIEDSVCSSDTKCEGLARRDLFGRPSR